MLNVVDLGIKSTGSGHIAICQISCPSRNDITKSYRFTDNFAQRQKRKIREYLNSLEAGTLVVFPECSIPEGMLREIIKCAVRKKMHIVGGLEYDHRLRNRCIVVTPSGKCYTSAKLNKSRYDHPEMEEGEYVNCFINSEFGDFAVLVCYDYTSSNLIGELSGKVDVVFIIANNPNISSACFFADI